MPTPTPAQRAAYDQRTAASLEQIIAMAGAALRQHPDPLVAGAAMHAWLVTNIPPAAVAAGLAALAVRVAAGREP